MFRLAILLPNLNGGGAERVMLNLACSFVEQGIGVDLVLVKAEGPYLAQVPPEVRVVNLGCQRLLLSLPALVGYLRRERPAAVLSASNDVNVMLLWSKRLAGVSTRVVVTVHNTLSRESQNATQMKRRLTPYLVRWFYPWADAIVSVSQGVAEDLARIAGLSTEHIQVIYNPVVTPKLLESAKEQVDHPWFAPGNSPVILGVGRLTKQKDFPTLIQAFALVRQTCPARLMILGEGEERTCLETLVRKLGLEEVVFPGFVANPYAYFAQASVCVLSSAWEGFGNVLVEAMAVGTPVVSTDCKSGPAEILENGQYGQLVTVGDAKGLAEAIVSTLERPPDSQMLQRRAAEFSVEMSLVQYLQVLHGGQHYTLLPEHY